MRVLYHLPRILELNVVKVNIFNAYSSHSSCRLSVVSCQLSVVSRQSSVVSCRLPVVGCQLSVAGCRLSL